MGGDEQAIGANVALAIDAAILPTLGNRTGAGLERP